MPLSESRDEFSRIEAECKEIFRLLKITEDPSEGKLLLQDRQMLLGLASRNLKSGDDRVKACSGTSNRAMKA